jgi:hypothetical protein
MWYSAGHMENTERKTRKGWLAYLIFMLLVYVAGLVGMQLDPGPYPWSYMDYVSTAFDIPAIIALGLYAFRKQWGSQKLWKVYFVVYLLFTAADVYRISQIDPNFSDPLYVTLYSVIALPLYIALYLYTFKSYPRA